MLSNLLGPDDYTAMPWKNGKGKTTELLCARAADDLNFEWRLSIASVLENGEFSDFAGYSRTLILLDGNGLRLNYESVDMPPRKALDTLLKQYDYCGFMGGWKTTAILIDGPIRDFNVMCRVGYCQNRQPVIVGNRSQDIECDADHQLFYAAEGAASWHVSKQTEPSAHYQEPSAKYKEPSARLTEPSAHYQVPSAHYKKPTAIPPQHLLQIPKSEGTILTVTGPGLICIKIDRESEG